MSRLNCDKALVPVKNEEQNVKTWSKPENSENNKQKMDFVHTKKKKKKKKTIPVFYMAHALLSHLVFPILGYSTHEGHFRSNTTEPAASWEMIRFSKTIPHFVRHYQHGLQSGLV